MDTGINIEFCVMKHLGEKLSLFPSFYQGINLYFSSSFLPAAGPSPSVKGILKSVSWLFLLMQNVFSFMPRAGVGRNGAVLSFLELLSGPVSGCLGLQPWEAGG